MNDRLDRILRQTRHDVDVRKRAADLADLEARASRHSSRGFAAQLREAARTAPAIIAELKKASPSKGMIRVGFDPASLAGAFEQAGAAALSVLTDEPFFQGSLRNLELAAAAVSIPCLRKDFIVDRFQVIEARAHGADAILLIVAAHGDGDLRDLRACARDYDLDVLCEVHTPEELDRALALDCEAIGVNSRDLRDFSVHPELLHELAAAIPSTIVRVAESGLSTPEELLALRAAGYDAFLIGEALMRQPDPGEALSRLLARCVPAAV